MEKLKNYKVDNVYYSEYFDKETNRTSNKANNFFMFPPDNFDKLSCILIAYLCNIVNIENYSIYIIHFFIIKYYINSNYY